MMKTCVLLSIWKPAVLRRRKRREHKSDKEIENRACTHIRTCSMWSRVRAEPRVTNGNGKNSQ
ncbi:AAEL004937-PA [Aedes aegypti]|uniref:AAEL004937-PA n=1 Tax=Aedes aegypti TaxID=7159 RepID=Q17BL5_AEDAE|nr:AAEL004937-PA [Aedes aegypti]